MGKQRGERPGGTIGHGSGTAALMVALSLALVPRTGLADSVVPSEACVDGEPVQVLNFAELPLEDTRARNMAESAGTIQVQGRLILVTTFLTGTVLALGGLTLAGLRLPAANENPVGRPLVTAGIGISIGAGGVWAGRWVLGRASGRATTALEAEEEATGREARWRTDEEPCANE